jgi:anti-sigma regulatory factor (Ser/Thr protein kinase)
MTVLERLRLQPVPSSARAARHCVGSVLPEGERVTDLAVLLVSELATNAILHAQSEFEVVVHSLRDRYRIEVCDSDTRLPTLRTYVAESITGRGLHMVAASADRWGFEATPTGKVVWFEVATDA